MTPDERIQRALKAKPPNIPALQQARPVPFVLASTDLGPLIVSRLDFRQISPTQAYGVGFQLLETSTYDQPEIELIDKLLDLKLQHTDAPHLTFIDCGANIGVHTIHQARRLRHQVQIIAIEAQERIFYALAGNVALNNCFNVRCLHAAVSDVSGTMQMPLPNYAAPASYGSLELRRNNRQDTGQLLDYAKTVEVQAIALDNLNLKRCDFLKIDVEGMELEVLTGADNLIEQQHPIILVEHGKTDRGSLEQWLDGAGYKTAPHGMNLLAIHKFDPCSAFWDLTDSLK